MRLADARFADGRLPIDSLTELPSYQVVVRIAAEVADQFWGYVWAIVEGLFWPAFMVYDLFAFLHH